MIKEKNNILFTHEGGTFFEKTLQDDRKKYEEINFSTKNKFLIRVFKKLNTKNKLPIKWKHKILFAIMVNLTSISLVLMKGANLLAFGNERFVIVSLAIFLFNLLLIHGFIKSTELISTLFEMFKKRKSLKELDFNETPVSLKMMKKIKETLSDSQLEQLLYSKNGVIKNVDVINKDFFDHNFSKDIPLNIKEITSCLSHFKEGTKNIDIEKERKENIDEMIERLEREMSERGVDVNLLLKL